MKKLWLVTMLAFAACGGKSTPKPAPAAAKPAADCQEGFFMYEGECLKECATDDDCGGKTCEQLHVMNEDGTIGPVAGQACASS
ncbi:MAG TPA: hypothetical protein VFQ53_18355 [Kofleriaceae bacterium]|nr:hypothetical protein [Kofleriaceae bacterium]